MPIRICSYKKCDNFVVDGAPSGNFTMFGFPKDEERRKEWVLFGNVANYDSKSKYFMCSDHFESKYICVSNRRRILIGEAKPIPYASMETRSGGGEVIPKAQKLKTGEEAFEQIEFYPILDNQQIESIKKKSEDDGKIKTTKVSLNGDGKRSSLDSNYGNLKKAKLSWMTEEIDDNKKTTTFIFNGEEYIQMPKSLYMEEKINLVEELQCYKLFVSQIESNLAGFLKNPQGFKKDLLK